MPSYRAVAAEVENERGEMEKWPGTPCKCGICKGERKPLMPGSPSRHDMAAGDLVLVAVVEV
jgi:hypothetical protein